MALNGVNMSWRDGLETVATCHSRSWETVGRLTLAHTERHVTRCGWGADALAIIELLVAVHAVQIDLPPVYKRSTLAAKGQQCRSFRSPQPRNGQHMAQ